MLEIYQKINLHAVFGLSFRVRPKNCLHTTCVRFKKVRPKNISSGGSAPWITRHLNDPYVKLSRYENYKARSAFKLIELDDKYGLLKPGQCVVDLGAAPGAWSQVLVNRVNSSGKELKKPKGTVIGVDLLYVHPVPGAVFLGNSDFTKESTKDKLRSLLNGKAIDVVLSDMCPNITGQNEIDCVIVTQLAYQVLEFSVKTLNVGGHILMKGFDGMESQKFYTSLEKFFQTTKRTKPPASRGDSSEMYFIGKDFKGIVTNKPTEDNI